MELSLGSGSLDLSLAVIVLVLIVFGAGRLPKTMSDLAKDVRAFEVGMRDDDLAGSGTVLTISPAPNPAPELPSAR